MFRFKPVLIISLGFLAVILSGAFLLWLPVSSARGAFTNPFDAFFTANSATCATNLLTLDAAGTFSLFGKLVILALIQIGGLGYMTFGTLMVLILRRDMHITDKVMIKEMPRVHFAKDIFGVALKVAGITFLIEAAGALVLFLRWIPEFGAGKAFLYGIFHSISAFCNAGLALTTAFTSMASYRGDIIINLTLTTLIILGGLGFLVIADIIQNRRLSLQSKIVIWSTLLLILAGTAVVFAVEYGNRLTIGSFGILGKLANAYFISVSARTAGFSMFPVQHMLQPSLLMIMVLMFIGASPGSTGSGIKTTTFSIIAATIWSTLHNRRNTIIAERRIPVEIVRRSLAVFFVCLTIVAAVIFILNATEKFLLMDIAFETFSAFGNVGLSTGITPLMSFTGKAVIACTIFLGRIFSLCLLASFTHTDSEQHIRYPKEGVSIG